MKVITVPIPGFKLERKCKNDIPSGTSKMDPNHVSSSALSLSGKFMDHARL